MATTGHDLRGDKTLRLIPEEMLPMSGVDNIDEYYSFKGADKACLKAGQDWLAKHDFKYEDVFKPNEPLEEKNQEDNNSLKVFHSWRFSRSLDYGRAGVYIRMGQRKSLGSHI